MSNSDFKCKFSLNTCENGEKIEREEAHGLADVEKFKLEEELAISLGECEKLKEEIVVFRDRQKEVADVIDGKDKQISDLTGQLRELDSRMVEIERENEELKSDKLVADDAMESMRRRMVEVSDVLEKLRYKLIAADADKVRSDGVIAELRCKATKLGHVLGDMKSQYLEALKELGELRSQLLEISSQAVEEMKCLEDNQTLREMMKGIRRKQELRAGAQMCKKKPGQVMDSASCGGDCCVEEPRNQNLEAYRGQEESASYDQPAERNGTDKHHQSKEFQGKGATIPDLMRFIKDLSSRNDFDKIQALLMERENEVKIRMENLVKDCASFQSGQALADLEKLKFKDLFEKSLLECNELKKNLSSIEKKGDGIIEEMRPRMQEVSGLLEKLKHQAMTAGADKIICDEIRTILRHRESLLDQIVEKLSYWNTGFSQMLKELRHQLSGANAQNKKSDKTIKEMRPKNIEAEIIIKDLRRECLGMLDWLLAAHDPEKTLDDTIEELRDMSQSEVGESLKETMVSVPVSGGYMEMVEKIWSQKLKDDKTIEELRHQNSEALEFIKELKCIILDAHEVYQVNKERWEASPRTMMVADGLINVLKFMVTDRAKLISRKPANDVGSPIFKGEKQISGEHITCVQGNLHLLCEPVEIINNEDEANLGKVGCVSNVSADLVGEKIITELPSPSQSIQPINLDPGKRKSLGNADNDYCMQYSRKKKKQVKKPTGDFCHWSLKLHKWVSKAGIPDNFEEEVEL